MTEAWELADDLHIATSHRDLAERLEVCEALLAKHGLRLDDLDSGLAAHAEEEITVVEIEDSDDAHVEISEAEAEGSGDAASGATEGDSAESGGDEAKAG